MATKGLTPNNGKLSKMLNDATIKKKIIGTFSVPKLLMETEVQLETHSNSEIKNISDHKKQVSKT